MPIPEESDRRFVGEFGTYEFAVVSDDRMADAWKWWVKADNKVQFKLQTLFERFIHTGVIYNETSLRHLDGDVWEFKRSTYRMLCYRIGDRCILTNALTKGGRKDITEDIAKAKHIGEGHLQWETSKKRRLGQ